jgi:hypothetical protein
LKRRSDSVFEVAAAAAAAAVPPSAILDLQTQEKNTDRAAFVISHGWMLGLVGI